VNGGCVIDGQMKILLGFGWQAVAH